MRYKCSNCGRFISKNSNVCKHCGAENSSVPVEEHAHTVFTNIYERTMTCPHCRSQIKVTNDLLNVRILKCLFCGGEFQNPYYKPSGFVDRLSPKQKRYSLFVGLTVLLMVLMIIGSKDAKNVSKDPQLSEEWKVAAQNQDFTVGNEMEYNCDFLLDIERKTGKRMLHLLQANVGKPQTNQDVLKQEPLRTLLISTYGSSIYNEILSYRKSDNWIMKCNESYTKYYYDCYKDVPNGDYFAMTYVEDGTDIAFFMEVKTNGKMHNLQISSFVE